MENEKIFSSIPSISDDDIEFLRRDVIHLLTALSAARQSGDSSDIRVAAAEFRSALALYLEARKFTTDSPSV